MGKNKKGRTALLSEMLSAAPLLSVPQSVSSQAAMIHVITRVNKDVAFSCVSLLFPVSGSSTLSFTKRLEPPAFVEALQDCHVDEGRNITLRAIITGSQPIKVSWLHNGELELFTLSYLLVIKGGK